MAWGTARLLGTALAPTEAGAAIAGASVLTGTYHPATGGAVLTYDEDLTRAEVVAAIKRIRETLANGDGATGL